MYTWEDRKIYPDPTRAKLKLKFPMKKEVVDIKGQLWEYYFVAGKMTWIYLGLIYFEQ